MAERMTIVVTPVGQESLTVEDAMRQVLDAFDLLSRTNTDQKIEWRLVEAKTSSPPFTVTAESVDPRAAQQKAEFVEAVKEVNEGRLPRTWDDPQAYPIYESMLLRVARGARLEVKPSAEEPAIAIREDAARYVAGLVASLPEVVSRTKDQIGSIEGYLHSVSVYRNRPAFVVRERKTNHDVTCVVSDEELAREIAQTRNFEDVWKHRRVIVRGLVRYNVHGGVLQVVATSITPVDSRYVSEEEIRDESFTDGLQSSDYVNKWRDGDLGT